MIRVVSERRHRYVCPAGLLRVSEGTAVPGADGLERWNGTVLDSNSTCANLGSQYLQLVGMHAQGDVGQPYTCDVIHYECRARGKKCSIHKDRSRGWR